MRASQRISRRGRRGALPARRAADAVAEALRASEEQLRLALAMTAMDAWSWHAPTGTLESRNIETLYGWVPGSFDGSYETYLASVHPEDRARVAAADAATASTGGDYDLDFRIVRPDGSVRWMAERGRVTERDAEGRAVRVIGTTLDVTDRKEAEAALRAREEEFRLLFAANPHPTWVYDRETLRFLEVNDAAITHYGYAREEFLAMTVAAIGMADDHARPATPEAAPADAILAGGCRHLTREGRPIDVEITAHPLLFRGRAAVLVVAQDVTARLTLERQLEHQAFHDPLTGLPNRALFRDRLAHALSRRTDRPDAIAVLFLDLDDFKVVNDTLGHAAGDRLLVAVAERLRTRLREGDTLARFGGDEFTVLLEDLPDRQTARMLADRLSAALRSPIRLGDRDVVATASGGIAVPPVGASADEVLRLADVALYEAKHRGKDRIAVFDVGMDARAWQRLGLEADLRRALAEGQFTLNYQPQVDLAAGHVAGVEALVRWQHPELGLVSPGEFVPLAEETGLIVPLGRWVLGEACRQVASWYRESPGLQPCLAVNLSAKQLQHPELLGDVAAALAQSGLAASSLTLEVTETAALEDVTGASAVMAGLKRLGVRVAIDDFGAGYAGLGYLRRYPVDELKVDRTFVAGLGRDPADAALIRAVVEYARATGIAVIAEGIETADQLAAVRALGCRRGQGFWFARPLPAEAVRDLLGGGGWALPPHERDGRFSAIA